MMEQVLVRRTLFSDQVFLFSSHSHSFRNLTTTKQTLNSLSSSRLPNFL